MKVKRILFHVLLFWAFNVGAYRAQAQVQIGVKAGLNLSCMVEDDGTGNTTLNKRKLKPGFHVGVTFDIPVADEFYVQPAALFSTKGSKFDTSPATGGQAEVTHTTYYLEVPVNLIYKPQLGDGHLLLGAGPYVAYGLSGKWKRVTTYTTDGNNRITTERLKFEFVNDYDDRSSDANTVVYGKPIDYGANVLLGYEFSNKISVQLNGQLGVPNLRPNGDGYPETDGKRKNFGFGVSVGCIL